MKKLIFLAAAIITVYAFIIPTRINASSLIPLLFIDKPLGGTALNNAVGNTVSGWALNPSGIKEVDVKLDGGTYKTVSSGLSRPDVARAFPSYPGAGSGGYTYTIAAGSLKAGSHTVTVKAVGKNGNYQTVTRTFSSVTLSPRTCIDVPAAGTVSGNNTDITVRGWALNASGIKQINIYADNATIPLATAHTSINRPDVAKVFPNYPSSGVSGFTSALPIGGFSSGNHTIRVEAVGNNGSANVITRTIAVQKSKMCLDSTTVPQYLSDTLSFSGWAVNSSTVSSVNLYIDGVLKTAASSNGLTRNDVAAVFGAYPNAAASGFAFSGIDITSLSAGSHTFKVTAAGGDGSLQAISFTAVKQPPIVIIEQAAYNSVNGSTVTVSGYALNATGIAQIYESIDGGTAQSIPVVVNNNPVGKYSGYKNIANGGFSVDIDISQYSTARHMVKITATGTDGASAFDTVAVCSRGTITYTPYSMTLNAAKTAQLKDDPGPGCYINGWKYINTTQGSYNYYKSGIFTAVNESSPFTIYNTIYSKFNKYINPLNLVDDDTDIYQFMKLTYVDGISASGLNSFFNPNGVLSGMGQAFIDAGKQYNVNPVYLAMHAIEETGNGTSALARGIRVNAGSYNVYGSVYNVAAADTYYNLFGVLAYDGNANLYGAEYAGAKGWNTVSKAIAGGAEWISYHYIDTYGIINEYKNQDTLYKMRWNPANPAVHQYATDILWAHNSAALIKQYYDKYSSASLTFDVPEYS